MKLLFASLVAVSALAFAAPSHAEPNSEETVDSAEFINSLTQVGIIFDHPDQAVAAAEALCGLAANGETTMELLNDVTEANPDLTVADAARFATIAAKTYCPHQLKKGGGGSK